MGEEKVTSRKRRRMRKKQKGERKEEDAAAEEVVELAGGGKKAKGSKRKNKRRKQINQEKQQKKKQHKLARITGAPEVAVDSLKIKPLTVKGPLIPNPQLIGGIVVRQGVSVPLGEPIHRCAKCNMVVERENARVTGERQITWVCKQCNSKGVQLSRLYGTSWPPRAFGTMSKKDVHEFYERIKGIRDAKDLKVFVDDQLEISKTNSTASRDESEALPLSVWLHRGFEREAILKCPSETHPQLGHCYRLSLNRKVDEEKEEHKQKQKIDVTDRTAFSQTRLLNPKANSAQAKEDIRQAKAEAAQEGRVLKKQAKLGNTFLRKIAKPLSNVSTFMAGKQVKGFSEAHKGKGTKLQNELKAMGKLLRQAVLAKARVEVSATACESLISAAETWHQQSVALLTAMATKF